MLTDIIQYAGFMAEMRWLDNTKLSLLLSKQVQKGPRHTGEVFLTVSIGLIYANIAKLVAQ